MSLKALSDYTFVSRYANYRNDLRRRENYHEATDRVKNMHLEKYPQVKDEIEWAFEKAHNKIALGSQRALQFGGKPIINKNSRLFNCISSYIDRSRVFQETFWLLLCGCGTGFSVQKHHVDKLPEFHNGLNSDKDFHKTSIFVVEDSIEGWADALGVLIASYMPNEEFKDWYGVRVFFDFSKIRPKGSPLGSGVGKAPGSDGLKKSLEKINMLLNNILNSGARKLSPINAYDIIMHASDAVLSGGVRRSATLAIFSPDDQEMLNAKTGNWYYTNPQRARSNNSALLLRNETGRESYHKLFESTRQFGEPGMIWASSTEALYNPCVTKDTLITTKNGIFKVEDLIGKQFDALVDGEVYQSTPKGFWKTGDKEVLRLKFESGRILDCTSNHQILTSEGWKEAGDITSEDEVFLNNHQSSNSQSVDTDSEDYAKGYLLGLFLADGTTEGEKSSVSIRWWGENKAEYKADAFKLIEQANMLSSHHNKNSLENKSLYSNISSVKLKEFAASRGCLNKNKHLSREAVHGSWSYLSGLIGGYFDADGTVIFNPQKGSSLRFWSTQLENLQGLQIALNAMGIQSKIYQDRLKRDTSILPDGKGGQKAYAIQKAHELCVSRNSIERFHDLIPLRNIEKVESLKAIIDSRNKTPYRSTFIDRIIFKETIGVQEVYDCTIPNVHAFDANGVYVHNCVEIGLYGYDKNGNSGWQACNLSTINGSKLKTKEDFAVAAKVAAIIGTLQAGYTDFAYLGPVSEEIIRQEALIGCSITGIMDHPDITLNPNNLREMAKLVLEINSEIAAKIGINEAARATAVKPEGTASCLLGTSSGVHPAHAKRYIRRTQANNMEAPVQHYKIYNPSAVEKSVWSSTGTDDVINFLIEMPSDVVTKDDITAVQFLETVKLVQENWVETGKRPEKCIQPWLSHNVSNTITVQPNEWEEVEEFIYENKNTFAGISLLGGSGDLDYPQAPFSKVLTEEELTSKYGTKIEKGKEIIAEASSIFDKNLWKTCDFLLGFAKLEENDQAKKEWIEKTKLISKELFGDDIKSFTYMLKEISNLQFWNELSKDHREVNWELLYEEDDRTEILQSVACAGGKCNFS